ncbi:HAD hydrolase-like protein [Patescibacteria group bacterium]|nr:HAD hydrolase-like protein [Patescibacteria group bacterium]
MNKPKIVLFDIDYTLFNALKFRKKILSEIKERIKENKFKNIERILENAYLESRQKVGYFDPSSFIRDINKKFGSDIPEAFLDEYVKKEELFEHLYKEVDRVLEELSKDKTLLIGIFSGGNKNFQKEKIKRQLNLFNKKHIHIFPYKKIELENMLKKYKNYKVFLIDDVLSILSKAKKIDKSIYAIWIKRGRFAKIAKKTEDFNPDKEVKNLNKIVSIINSN